jgi:hypothetical protein
LIPGIKEVTQTEGVSEQGVEETIWIEERLINGRFEITAK